MSEAGIDMERCMQGVDDEESWRPEITWTNCAEEIPLDGNKYLIIRVVATNIKQVVRVCQIPKHRSTLEWTTYTQEKWEELDK